MARLRTGIQNQNGEVIAKYDVNSESDLPEPLRDLSRTEVDTVQELSDITIDQYDPDALDPEVRAIVGDPPELEPDPDEAYDQIAELLTQTYADQGADDPEVEAVDLLSRNSGFERMIDKGNFGVAVRFAEKKVQSREDVVDDALVDDIAGILRVKR